MSYRSRLRSAQLASVKCLQPSMALRAALGASWRAIAGSPCRRSLAARAMGPMGGSGLSSRKVQVRHILADSEATIDEVAVQLESGADFAELAKQHSTCPSKANGGNVGWIIRGMASSVIEDAVLQQPVGARVRVESDGGWHLIEVLKESQPPGQAAAKAPRPRVGSVTVQDLHAVLSDPTRAEVAQFVDVREMWEFEHARLPGFRLFPLSALGDWLPGIAEELDPDKATYVLCHHGVRSLQASNMLVAQGFHRVYNVSGGIASYSSLVDRSVPHY